MTGPVDTPPAVVVLERRRATLVTWCRKLLLGENGIECIHQARIGTRRFRTALRVAAPLLRDGVKRRPFKLTRQLGRDLGVVRDADVFLRHLARQRPAGNPGRAEALRFAREKLRRRREKGLSRLEPVVRQFMDGVGDGPDRAVVWPLAAVEEPGGPELPPVTVKGVLEPFMREVLAHRDAVVQRRDIAKSHLMRIGAKRMRYAIEILREVSSGTRKKQLGEGLRVCKQIQGDLGDIHDHDVWLAQFKKWRKTCGGGKKRRPLAGGLKYLARIERDRRDRYLDQFLGWWRLHEQEGALSRLQELCQDESHL